MSRPQHFFTEQSNNASLRPVSTNPCVAPIVIQPFDECSSGNQPVSITDRLVPGHRFQHPDRFRQFNVPQNTSPRFVNSSTALPDSRVPARSLKIVGSCEFSGSSDAVQNRPRNLPNVMDVLAFSEPPVTDASTRTEHLNQMNQRKLSVPTRPSLIINVRGPLPDASSNFRPPNQNPMMLRSRDVNRVTRANEATQPRRSNPSQIMPEHHPGQRFVARNSEPQMPVAGMSNLPSASFDQQDRSNVLDQLDSRDPQPFKIANVCRLAEHESASIIKQEFEEMNVPQMQRTSSMQNQERQGTAPVWNMPSGASLPVNPAAMGFQNQLIQSSGGIPVPFSGSSGCIPVSFSASSGCISVPFSGGMETGQPQNSASEQNFRPLASFEGLSKGANEVQTAVPPTSAVQNFQTHIMLNRHLPGQTTDQFPNQSSGGFPAANNQMVCGQAPMLSHLPQGYAGQVPSGPPYAGQVPSGPPYARQVPSGPPYAGQVPSGPPYAGQVPSGPPYAGQVPSGPPYAGQVPSGPPYAEQVPHSYQGVVQSAQNAQNQTSLTPDSSYSTPLVPQDAQGVYPNHVGPSTFSPPTHQIPSATSSGMYPRFQVPQNQTANSFCPNASAPVQTSAVNNFFIQQTPLQEKSSSDSQFTNPTVGVASNFQSNDNSNLLMNLSSQIFNANVESANAGVSQNLSSLQALKNLLQQHQSSNLWPGGPAPNFNLPPVAPAPLPVNTPPQNQVLQLLQSVLGSSLQNPMNNPSSSFMPNMDLLRPPAASAPANSDLISLLVNLFQNPTAMVLASTLMSSLGMMSAAAPRVESNPTNDILQMMLLLSSSNALQQTPKMPEPQMLGQPAANLFQTLGQMIQSSGAGRVASEPQVIPNLFEPRLQEPFLTTTYENIGSSASSESVALPQSPVPNSAPCAPDSHGISNPKGLASIPKSKPCFVKLSRLEPGVDSRRKVTECMLGEKGSTSLVKKGLVKKKQSGISGNEPTQPLNPARKNICAVVESDDSNEGGGFFESGSNCDSDQNLPPGKVYIDVAQDPNCDGQKQDSVRVSEASDKLVKKGRLETRKVPPLRFKKAELNEATRRNRDKTDIKKRKSKQTTEMEKSSKRRKESGTLEKASSLSKNLDAVKPSTSKIKKDCKESGRKVVPQGQESEPISVKNVEPVKRGRGRGRGQVSKYSSCRDVEGLSKRIVIESRDSPKKLTVSSDDDDSSSCYSPPSPVVESSSSGEEFGRSKNSQSKSKQMRTRGTLLGWRGRAGRQLRGFGSRSNIEKNSSDRNSASFSEKNDASQSNSGATSESNRSGETQTAERRRQPGRPPLFSLFPTASSKSSPDKDDPAGKTNSPDPEMPKLVREATHREVARVAPIAASDRSDFAQCERLQSVVLRDCVNSRMKFSVQMIFCSLIESRQIMNVLCGLKIDNQLSFQCAFCPYIDTVVKNISAHSCNAHADVLFAAARTPLPSGDVLYLYCRHCDFVSHDKLSMWIHFEMYHGIPDVLLGNDISKVSPSASRRVVLKEDDLSQISMFYQCLDCGVLVSDARHIAEHIVENHRQTGANYRGSFCKAKIVNKPKNVQVSVTYKELLSSKYAEFQNDVFVCVQCTYCAYTLILAINHHIFNHLNLKMVYACSAKGCDNRELDPAQFIKHFRSDHHSDADARIQCSVSAVGESDGQDGLDECVFENRGGSGADAGSGLKKISFGKFAESVSLKK